MSTTAWWIGDPVQIVSSGIKGKYHGAAEPGFVFIKLADGSITSTPASDIRLVEEEIETVHETFQWIPEKNARRDVTVSQSYRLDLHYENLTRHFIHRSELTILEFQIEVCTQFIQAAIESRMPFIRIIYGRGKGVLKNEIEKLLRQHSEFTLVSSNPNMAAVDAWIK